MNNGSKCRLAGEQSIQPVRIMFLTSMLDKWGGSEKNIWDVVTNLPKDKFQTYVFALKGGRALQAIKEQGVAVEDLAFGSIVSWSGLAVARKIYRFLKKEQIQILVTYHEDADLYGGVLGKLAKVPEIISSKRDMGYQITKAQSIGYKFVNKFFTRILAVSEAVKTAYGKIHRLPLSNITVIHNGIDPKVFCPTNQTGYLHRVLKLPPNIVLVGMVASFRAVKGHEIFVGAAAKVLKSSRNVEFIIVGSIEGDYYQQVKKIMQDLGIRSKIHCLGHRDDIQEILNTLDIFVLSSFHEGFSNAILEAMAVGLPVIAPKSGGNAEIVNSDNGILFKPGDVDRLSESILHLLENEHERRNKGQRGRELVRREFSLEGMIAKYIDLFQSRVSPAGEIKNSKQS